MYAALKAKEAGLEQGRAQGYRNGYENGLAEGRAQGNNSALKDMQPWVDKTKALEGMLAEGGLRRLWRNKLIFTTERSQFSKSPLKDRRLVFLHMLAYAEYHQRHIKDPVDVYDGLADKVHAMSNRMEAEAQKAGANKATEQDQIDAMMSMGAEVMKTAQQMKAIAKDAKQRAYSMREGQKDERLDEWIQWRVKQLLETAKYDTPSAVIPKVKSLGDSPTSKKVGTEIVEDSFDIVSDAKKYLGETRTVSQIGVGY